MKNLIYVQAVGSIMVSLTEIVSGGFTTENTHNSFIINFNHNHNDYSVEVVNYKHDNMYIYLNNDEIGSCLEIEKVLNKLNNLIK